MTLLEKRYCTIKELSVYTGFPEGTLYEWASAGVIPSIKIRKRILFDLQEIDDCLTAHKRNSLDSENIAKKTESGYDVPDSGHLPIKPQKGG